MRSPLRVSVYEDEIDKRLFGKNGALSVLLLDPLRMAAPSPELPKPVNPEVWPMKLPEKMFEE